MTDDIDDFLAHYGVKGMKWGVRKDGLTRSRARAVEKDRAWIEDAQRAYNQVATSAAMHLNKEVLPQINAKYAVEGKGVRNSQYDAYINELTKAYEDELDKRMYAAIGRSPSGKHSLKWHAEQADIKLPWAELVYSEKKMAHADTAPMIVRFVPKEDGTVEMEVVSREEFESSVEEVEHSVDDIDDFLAHYGVKGMKWGVRRDLKRLDSGARDAYLKKKESPWFEKLKDPKVHAKVSSQANRSIKKETKQLVQFYKDQKVNLKRDAKARKRFEEEVRDLTQSALDRVANKVTKGSRTGMYEPKVSFDPVSGKMKIEYVVKSNDKIVRQLRGINRAEERRVKKAAKTETIKHAESLVESIEFDLDEEGFPIISDEVVEEVEHSMVDDIDDFLAHYGVKGMRWGVRKARDSSSGGRKKSGSSNDSEESAPKPKPKAKRGSDLSKYSDDKLTSMTANLKGLDALSDAELKKLTGRMQLEQTYRDLKAKQPKTMTRAEKFLHAAKLLGATASQITEFTKSPAGMALLATVTKSGGGRHLEKKKK